MQQLTLTEKRDVEWLEVPTPQIKGPGQALVRPIAVALCDLDQPTIRGETPIPGPIALGHESVAEVVEVGEGVSTVSPGDLVVVPFQISCGECPRCRAGLTGNCLSVPERSMYGFGPVVGGDWGGALSDLLRVPFADAMLVPLPDGVAPEHAASVCDNVVDGWRTVAPHLERTPGADVLIVAGGAHSISLYAVQTAVAMGAGSVSYVDADESRLGKAAELGAVPVEAAEADDLPKADSRSPSTAPPPKTASPARSARPSRVAGARASGSSTSSRSRCRCWRCTATASTSTSAGRCRARRSPRSSTWSLPAPSPPSGSRAESPPGIGPPKRSLSRRRS